MFSRNTSTPARKRLPMTSLSDDAGPRVATILTFRSRLKSFSGASQGKLLLHWEISAGCQDGNTTGTRKLAKPPAMMSKFRMPSTELERIHLESMFPAVRTVRPSRNWPLLVHILGQPTRIVVRIVSVRALPKGLVKLADMELATNSHQVSRTTD